MQKEGISFKEVAIIGDDMNDYRMLNTEALTFCPQDANHHIKAIVDYVLETKGGSGVAKEMIDKILAQDIVAKNAYLRQYQ